ncbi:putative hydrophobic protein (TIGR00271 family) [Streptacidiphilus sp. MAP12-20]|uniref:DUF389 domain-containing protein n=1 Tax=Streptacidiphilus sp. MAP12-20 TaxID=3156299 RepID=UPI00351806F6
MMHLRLIVPPSQEARVRALLDQALGVTHLVVLPGAAVRPAGTVIECDVARESTDELLAALRDSGLAREGAITMRDAGFTQSDAATRALEEAPGEGADAVVWEAVSEMTQEESTLSLVFVAFLTVATMLAACGVMLDNAILIVGAMVVGPEFGPLAGLCVALVRRQRKEAWRSVVTLVIGFMVAILLTILFSLLLEHFGVFKESQFEAPRPQTSFIWQPDILSLLVAMLAGVAGMLSLTSAKSATLIGVAISVTTVPAAGNAALAVTFHAYAQGWGSFVQLGVNLAGIAFAGTLTLIVQRLLWSGIRRRELAALRR